MHAIYTVNLMWQWIDLFTTYTQEAKWYAMEYTPTLKEYMRNAWISISAPVILTHAFFLITNPIQNDVVHSLYKYHDLVRYSAMLLRLANDLGTSPVRTHSFLFHFFDIIIYTSIFMTNEYNFLDLFSMRWNEVMCQSRFNAT